MGWTKEQKRFLPYLPFADCESSGFMLYSDDLNRIRDFTTAEQRGMILDALVDFLATGEVPDFGGDKVCGIAWGFVADKITRDRENYILQVWKNRLTSMERDKPKDQRTPFEHYLYTVCCENPEFPRANFPEYAGLKQLQPPPETKPTSEDFTEQELMDIWQEKQKAKRNIGVV